ncbi:MAG: cupin domain-containing protein, partial [Gammaproteobacteria bacterium]
METAVNQLLCGLTSEIFLADYWQKKPLLIRNAIADFKSPIDPDELAGLACEDEVESRLILERDGPHPWALEHGPFAEERFTELLESHWTLLVQECNKYVPELADLMDRFDFIPSWRVDDVMVSYAPDQGTVGPHTDQYDVFLLQGLGKRRWQISAAPVDEKNRLPDLDLNIMRDFQATEEWILEPGDMLYLPPGLAHHGVAMGDCMTLSIGFRAPAHADILTGFTDSVASKLGDSLRYSDPDLSLQQHSGEISSESLLKVREIIRSTTSDNNSAIDSWFGRFVTESKSGELAIEPEQTLTPEQFLSLFQEHTMLERSDVSRFAFITEDDANILFIDGREYPLTNELSFAAPLLCDQRQHIYANLTDKLAQSDFTSLLTELYNSGYVIFNN